MFKKTYTPKKEKDCKIKKYNLINMKMQSQVHIFRCCYLFDYSCKIIQKYEGSYKSHLTKFGFSLSVHKETFNTQFYDTYESVRDVVEFF